MPFPPSHRLLSRRKIIGLGAASALLAPHAFGQSVREEAPSQPGVEQGTIAAANDAFKHMTIGVMVNGKGPFRFVIDTGADRSVIADSVADEIGIRRSGKVIIEGVVRTVPAETVRVANLEFGPVNLSNLVLPVLPHAWLDADGYLGLDAIARYRVVLDFRNRELRVEKPQGFWDQGIDKNDSVSVDARGSHGHLRVTNSRIDGVHTSTFLDTGAAISIGNRALFEGLRRKHPEYALSDRNVKISGVTGGSVTGLVMDFDRIDIPRVELTSGSIVIADLQIFDVWGLADKPALLIGMNFLRQFGRVTIDFGRKEYRFMVSQLHLAQNA
jgi:predicted aspartyl protease